MRANLPSLHEGHSDMDKGLEHDKLFLAIIKEIMEAC